MMTEQKYEARRIHIAEQYETKLNRAVAWRDQQLAILFYESCWTQQKIADKEGKSNQWVSYRLRFGRFLEYLPTMVGKPPVNLNERRFRKLWEQYGGKVTANTTGETKKFQAIIDSEEWELQIADKPAFPTNDLITERCTDNRWRSVEDIEEEIKVPDDNGNRVPNAIQRIKSANSGGLMVMEKTFAGGITKFRFKVIKNKDAAKKRAVVVAAELAPIVQEIERGLACKQALDAVGLIKGQMHRLHKLIKDYS